MTVMLLEIKVMHCDAVFETYALENISTF